MSNYEENMFNMIEVRMNQPEEEIKSIHARNGFKVFKSTDFKIRSSIYSPDGNMVGFSPLSSVNIDECFDGDNLKSDTRAEEYVEGTMINLFHYNNEWHISTKSTVGGYNSFYMNGQNKPKTFRCMFDECCQDSNLQLDTLNKEYSYSFVMKHKENRIINPINENQLYLIATYKCSSESYPDHINMIIDYKITNSNVKYPEIYSFTSKNELKEKFAMPYTDYILMGVNIFNLKTGNRSKMRNPCYEELKKLRGNQAKMEFHYLTLRKQNKLDEFLDFFPEYEEDFNLYEAKIINFKNELFTNFNDCYLKHIKPLGEYAPKYKNHMFSIHDTYLKTRTPTNIQTVDTYLKTIPEAVLMGSINYEHRKTI